MTLTSSAPGRWERWAIGAAMLFLVLQYAHSSKATLIDRGDGLIYDTALNITWMQDADLSATVTFGVSGAGTGMAWSTADDWISAMNAADYKGYSDWRLPYASVSVGPGVATSVVDCSTATQAQCEDNEMGYMFFYNLGETLGNGQRGNLSAGAVTLYNIEGDAWSDTQYPSAGALDWYFGFDTGCGNGCTPIDPLISWAVRPGDVSAIPEPSTLALLSAGLFGLGFFRRREIRKAAQSSDALFSVACSPRWKSSSGTCSSPS